MNTQRIALFVAVSASALLAGCGGGSDSTSPASNDNTTPAAVTAANSQGVYSGTVAGGPGNVFSALLLEDGSYYALSGTSSGGALSVTDFIQGTGTYSGSTFTSSNGIDFGATTAVAGSLSATVVPATSISGTATASGSGAVRTFNGTYLSNSGYNYDTAASLSAIAGSWSLGDLSGGSVNIAISASGALTGTGSQGCAFTGQVSPRASGKNVFDVTVTTQGAPCALPNTAFRGIALSYLIAGSSTRQLIVAGTDTARAHGTAFFGTR